VDGVPLAGKAQILGRLMETCNCLRRRARICSDPVHEGRRTGWACLEASLCEMRRVDGLRTRVIPSVRRRLRRSLSVGRTPNHLSWSEP
jgi:hypothetical protein